MDHNRIVFVLIQLSPSLVRDVQFREDAIIVLEVKWSFANKQVESSSDVTILRLWTRLLAGKYNV